MTREEFIEILHTKEYSYEIIGDKLVITEGGDVFLRSLGAIPSGVEFRNGGDVYLVSLKTLPSDVSFSNKGYVDLESLKTISSGVEFNNIKFPIWLGSLTGNWFSEWKGNIKGIDSNRLLNMMIKKGVFL